MFDTFLWRLNFIWECLRDVVRGLPPLIPWIILGILVGYLIR